MLFDKSGNALYTNAHTGIVRSISHMGYNIGAPENTLPAYILAKKKGYNCVECDIQITSDGYMCLLHDTTIDRTSDGSGNLWEMTYEEASSHDYGSWFSEDYAGTTIPTIEEFLSLCKDIGLHAYIELKWQFANSEWYSNKVVDIVKKCGMKGNVTYISYDVSTLAYIKAKDSTARLGYLTETITSNTITAVQGLKLDTNEVFIDANMLNLTDDTITLCVDADIPLEVYIVDTSEAIRTMNPYITGVTSDNLIAEKVLFDKHMTV